MFSGKTRPIWGVLVRFTSLMTSKNAVSYGFPTCGHGQMFRRYRGCGIQASLPGRAPLAVQDLHSEDPFDFDGFSCLSIWGKSTILASKQKQKPLGIIEGIFCPTR